MLRTSLEALKWKNKGFSCRDVTMCPRFMRSRTQIKLDRDVQLSRTYKEERLYIPNLTPGYIIHIYSCFKAINSENGF
jgi:hypothetical protein